MKFDQAVQVRDNRIPADKAPVYHGTTYWYASRHGTWHIVKGHHVPPPNHVHHGVRHRLHVVAMGVIGCLAWVDTLSLPLFIHKIADPILHDTMEAGHVILGSFFPGGH